MPTGDDGVYLLSALPIGLKEGNSREREGEKRGIVNEREREREEERERKKRKERE